MGTRINLQLLTVFCAVAEQTSFSKAAAQLGVAKGTVSRSIAQLESQLGMELIHRTTQHVSLSTAGAELYARTRAHLRGLEAAVSELPELHEEPSGLLRITAPHGFGDIVLPPLLHAFRQRHPAIRFEVRLSAERLNLVKEGFDLAFRASVRPLEDSTLTVRRLLRPTMTFFAAPSYLARRGRPKRLGDENHAWVLHTQLQSHFRLATEKLEFVVDDFKLARNLGREGAGVVALPDFLAQEYVREGHLERVVLEDTPSMTGTIVLLYPSSGQLSRKVATFRDYVVEALGAAQPSATKP